MRDRVVRLLPLTYLAGIHGFAIFAPYLAICTAIVVATHRTARKR